MSAGVYDLRIEAGAAFVRTFRWTDAHGLPLNLTGYSAALQLRDPAGQLVDDWADYFTIDGAAGQIALTVPASKTAAIAGSGRYDLELTPPAGPDATVRFLQGQWSVSPEVTQP